MIRATSANQALRVRIRLAVALAASVCCVAAAAAPAHAAVIEPGGAAARAAAYWTPERMEAAQPRGLRPAPARLVREAGGERVLPAGFGSYEILDYASRPFSANGKIFASSRGGDYQCSGTVVGSANQSVVLTAGHCLYLKRFGWARNLVFVPSYHEGAQPYGVWAARELLLRRKWVRRTAPAFDFGAVVVAPGPTATLESSVGAYPLGAGQPRRQSYRVAGYPVNYFDGQRMTGCHGPFVGVDWRTGSTGIRCDLGPGSSGGGWIVQDQYLASVMSYTLRGRRDYVFGPRLRGSAARLVARAGSL